jgi:hypothetical protein
MRAKSSGTKALAWVRVQGGDRWHAGCRSGFLTAAEKPQENPEGERS